MHRGAAAGFVACFAPVIAHVMRHRPSAVYGDTSYGTLRARLRPTWLRSRFGDGAMHKLSVGRLSWSHFPLL